MDDLTNAAAVQAADAAPVRHVSERPREKLVPLEWPVEHEGKRYDAIRVKRVTAAEMADFLDAIVRGEKAPMPVFDAPAAVLDALDADDDRTLMEEAAPFFPRALRNPKASEPTP